MAGEDGVPNPIFFKLLELSETSRARKLIVGRQFNMYKANIRRYRVLGVMAEAKSGKAKALYKFTTTTTTTTTVGLSLWAKVFGSKRT